MRVNASLLQRMCVILALFLTSCDRQSSQSDKSGRPVHKWVPTELVALATSPEEWAGTRLKSGQESPWPHVIDFCEFASLATRDREFLALTDQEREKLKVLVERVNDCSAIRADFNGLFTVDGRRVGVPALVSLSRMIYQEAIEIRGKGGADQADAYANALFVMGWSVLLSSPKDQMEALALVSLANLYLTRAIEATSAERQQELKPFYEQLQSATKARPQLR